jgi:hypothetical protein
MRSGSNSAFFDAFTFGTFTTVQVPNLALVEMKRITV